jgi:hypothetical protein
LQLLYLQFCGRYSLKAWIHDENVFISLISKLLFHSRSYLQLMQQFFLGSWTFLTDLTYIAWASYTCRWYAITVSVFMFFSGLCPCVLATQRKVG